jgi:phytoene desaturase
MNSNKTQSAVIIGGGIGGLATAAMLAKSGYKVTLLEKNARLGGKANFFSAEGFKFDMGPSWYLMPDVFEHFFKLLGEDVDEHLTLQRLDPSYRIAFRNTDRVIDMTSDVERDSSTFETLESGSGQALKTYLDKSKYQYDIAINYFMYKNYDSVFDFMNRQTMVEGRRLHVFEKMHNYVSRYFKSDITQKIMEYQLVFLGSSPYNTPALYNIMSHIDFNLGVFYPKGGIYSIITALENIGRKYGAEYRTSSPVAAISTQDGRASGVVLENGETISADIVISNADIHHTEMKMLPAKARSYTEAYWQKRTLAPSAFIMYLGIKGKIPSLVHHNLSFCQDWKQNFAEIFDAPRLPDDPSYYICAPSVTDASVAPKGHENLFVLVPVASGVMPTDEELEAYGTKILALVAKDFSIPDLQDRIVYKRTYTSKDFISDYNALGGSALGLAHTIKQTAIFRPNNVSKKLKNLYYVGANTNPGIGMPICLISAELAYKRIIGDKSSGPLQTL